MARFDRVPRRSACVACTLPTSNGSTCDSVGSRKGRVAQPYDRQTRGELAFVGGAACCPKRLACSIRGVLHRVQLEWGQRIEAAPVLRGAGLHQRVGRSTVQGTACRAFSGSQPRHQWQQGRGAAASSRVHTFEGAGSRRQLQTRSAVVRCTCRSCACFDAVALLAQHLVSCCVHTRMV